MLETTLLAFLLITLLLILVRYFWKQWCIAERTSNVVVRLAPALVELPEFFALLDRSTDRSHFMHRHGPILNRPEIRGRAMTGTIPFSGIARKPVTSARWLTHADLLYTVDSALEHWPNGARPKGGSFNFLFDYPIGEGYKKGESTLRTTRCARVIIRHGEVVTAFPVLEPKKSFQPTRLSAKLKSAVNQHILKCHTDKKDGQVI